MQAVISAINHVLSQNAWAREELARYAGKTICLSCLPLEITLRITENGMAEHGEVETPDASLSITPSGLMRYFLSEPRDNTLITMTGNSDFATAVGQIMGQVRWEAEEDLSRLVGDMAAHRVANFGRSFLGWAKQAADSIPRNFAEYLTEEEPLIASKHEVEKYLREVDEVRDAVERLEKRIVGLEKQN